MESFYESARAFAETVSEKPVTTRRMRLKKALRRLRLRLRSARRKSSKSRTITIPQDSKGVAQQPQPLFQKFLDLPLELRERIYTLRFLEDESERGQQDCRYYSATRDPPLTMVSRLLRREALPIFYATHTFRITIYNPKQWTYYHRAFRQRWFHRLPQSKVALVRNFELHIPCNNGRGQEFLVYRIHADVRGGKYDVQLLHLHYRATETECIATMLRVEATMARLASDPGVGNLTAKHYQRILEMDDGLGGPGLLC